MDQRYDLCVIGAGTAGFAAAEVARELGRSVVVVTGEGELGGTCIRRGCMPAKTLLSSTERLGNVASAKHLGVRVGSEAVDLRAVVARKRELVDYFSDDRAADLERYPLVRGRARFVAHDAIDVGDRRIAARAFVVATGSHVAAPTIPGLHRDAYFTSDDALEATHVPRRLAVVGGGPVGCEFAQYFARLGARVTLVQSEARLLRNEDDDVADAIARALVADGVDVRLGCEVTAVRDADHARPATEALHDGAPATTARTIAVRDATGASDLVVDAIMLATGREPHVGALDLARAGVAHDRGGIAVDATLQTSNPIVFAAGDVLGRRCLVHVAEYAGRIAARNALSGSRIVADFDRYETHAVYTQPQVAVAGLTERACRERGIAIAVRHHPFADVGKALVSDMAHGFVKMLAEPGGRIVGVAVVGDDAIDLIGEAIALVDRGATTREVADMPHLHPTMGEIFGRVADDFARAAVVARAS
ncbi:MAG: mercury(II) reductase [Vulcanimicrobiaceae bacterium]